jgi:hypothetical protein
MPARKSSTAKRKTVARKKPVAKKRVSTREPTRIIKRKKPSARKSTARAQRAKSVAKREDKVKAKLADDSALSAKAVAMSKRGKTPAEIAEKLGVSQAKVKRYVNASDVKPKDRIVGTPAEIGAKIVKLRDEEGVPWPTIRARTGLSGGAIRKLYEEASGYDWRDSGPIKEDAPAKKKATAKKAGRVKAGTKTDRTKKVRKVRKTRKSTSDALTEANDAKSKAKRAGRPKGPRARREEGAKLLRDVVWDSDSSVADLNKALSGKTITIEREGLRSQEVKVEKVKDSKVSDRMGKVIEFTSDGVKTRFVATREIAAIK